MLTNKNRIVITILAAIVLSAAIILGGSAVTASAAQSAIPGDTLYPVKISLEQMRMSMARDAGVCAELQLKYAERRFEEAKSLIAEGQFQNVQHAVLEIEVHINNALAELDVISDGDPALAADLVKRIANLLSRYTETLSELANNFPEPVRTEVLQTISDVSSRVTDKLVLGGLSGWSGYSDDDDNNYNENMNDSCSFGAVSIDELIVPQNATCTLNGTRVEGNIFVYDNSTLLASDVWVGGNIQADHSARVEVHSGSYVGGNIQVDYSGYLLISSVQISGDLQAFNNSGGVSIQNNTIEGNLQCKENYPAPTGGNNTVYGNKEDQCYDL